MAKQFAPHIYRDWLPLFMTLPDEQAAEAIAVGIDAGIQGPLLTTPGKDYADDRQLALAAGYEVVQS